MVVGAVVMDVGFWMRSTNATRIFAGPSATCAPSHRPWKGTSRCSFITETDASNGSQTSISSSEPVNALMRGHVTRSRCRRVCGRPSTPRPRVDTPALPAGCSCVAVRPWRPTCAPGPRCRPCLRPRRRPAARTSTTCSGRTCLQEPEGLLHLLLSMRVPESTRNPWVVPDQSVGLARPRCARELRLVHADRPVRAVFGRNALGSHQSSGHIRAPRRHRPTSPAFGAG